MGWPFQLQKSSDKARVEEANRAIATIFSPSHATLPDSAPKDYSSQGSSSYKENTQERQGDRCAGTTWLTTAQNSGISSQGEGSTTLEKGFSSSSSSWISSLFGSHRFFSKGKPPSANPPQPLRATSSDASDDTTKLGVVPLKNACETAGHQTSIMTLDELPVCPIAGYKLDKERGLVDIYEYPPHTLSSRELRLLIIELSSIEQKAKNTVDRQFGTQMNSRGLRGMELLINPCILFTGLYFMTWRAARLWKSALPRHSFLLNSCLKFLRWRMPAEKQEKLAREHRRLMQATNTHLTMSFIFGLFMVIVSWITWPSLDVVETAPEMVVGKQNVAYQQHSTTSLKWLWFVYYNHPAYASQAVSVLTPKILQ